jgi:acetoin utilization protein AcuC
LNRGSGSAPTNPIRAKLATEKLLDRLAESARVIEPQSEEQLVEDRLELSKAASPSHIAQALDRHESDLWAGTDELNAKAAFAMFGGTVRVAHAILDGSVKVGFNPQGAKHHAHFDYGHGFCEFNDLAWAAREFQSAGLKPLYLDWDIHAGDGLFDDLNGTGIPVLSIHNGSIFPAHREMSRPGQGGQYTVHHPERAAYNWCIDHCDGDAELLQALAEASEIIDDYAPDVILLAAGADGHEGPNALGLDHRYTYSGFEQAADLVANLARRHCEGRVLIGGAGGYQAETHTPEVWARVVERIYRGSAIAN